MEFLETWQKKQSGDQIEHEYISAKDRSVIVIGGGDTATDCIGTSLRQVRLFTFTCISLLSMFIRILGLQKLDNLRNFT